MTAEEKETAKLKAQVKKQNEIIAALNQKLSEAESAGMNAGGDLKVKVKGKYHRILLKGYSQFKGRKINAEIIMADIRLAEELVRLGVEYMKEEN